MSGTKQLENAALLSETDRDDSWIREAYGDDYGLEYNARSFHKDYPNYLPLEVETRIIFLDFDGVLNSAAYWECAEQHGGVSPFDPVLLARLDALIERTDAHIVVTSSWRGNIMSSRNVLKAWGLKHWERVIGTTPDLSIARSSGLYVACERGDEVSRWLREADPEGVTRYVILDDGHDFGGLTVYLVRTDYLVGLTEADAEKAVSILETDALWHDHPGHRGDRDDHGTLADVSAE